MSTAGAPGTSAWREGAPTTGRLLRRLGVVAGLALVLVGAAAGPAAAHAVGTGTEASNYLTTVQGIDQGTPGISVRAVTGGLLELTNRSGQEVLVLGYRLEPYLRIGPDGVFENRRSPSTYTNRFRTAPASIPSEFDAQAAPDWQRIGDGPSAGWHDHRAHWTGPDPPAVKANPGAVQVVRTWDVPLRQGKTDMLIRGTITWVPGPAPWPWLLVALGLFAAALAGAGGYQRPRVLAVVALVAVAADMVHTAGALLASTAPLATQLYGTATSAAGWVVSGMAAYRLLRGRADTGLIYLLLGGVFLTLAGALPDLSALARSQLPSGFGPVVTRAAITFTLGLGAAMVVAGLAGFRTPHRAQPAEVS